MRKHPQRVFCKNKDCAEKTIRPTGLCMRCTAKSDRMWWKKDANYNWLKTERTQTMVKWIKRQKKSLNPFQLFELAKEQGLYSQNVYPRDIMGPLLRYIEFARTGELKD